MAEPPNQEPEPTLLGIDFVFEMGMKKIEEQLKEFEALDLKVSVLFGFLGAVLIALLATYFASEERTARILIGSVVGIPLVLGVTFTGIAIWNAFQAFRLRQTYSTPRFADLFYKASEDPKQTKYEFLNTLLIAEVANKEPLDRKLYHAMRAAWFVLLGFLTFLGATIIAGAKALFSK